MRSVRQLGGAEAVGEAAACGLGRRGVEDLFDLRGRELPAMEQVLIEPGPVGGGAAGMSSP